MNRYFIFLAVSAMAACNTGIAQSFQTLMYDNSQSEVFGAANMRILHKAVYTFQDRYLPDSINSEKGIGRKLAGITYRAAKGFLVDFQEDFFIALIQHEAFGHGSRYREFGYTENSITLSPFLPFGKGGGSAKRGKLSEGEIITPQEDITMILAGNEANLLLAGNIAEAALLDNSLHYREALLYLVAQNNQLYYIWRTQLQKKGPLDSGDIASYLMELNNLPHGDKALTIDDLARQSLVSLLNPVQLYSAFTLVYQYGINGRKRIYDLPMIPIGGVRYLPAFNYSLTPFGPQYHFINYLKYRQMLIAGELTLGNSEQNDYYGVNIRALNLLATRALHASLYACVWNQPELELENEFLKTFKNRSGVMIKADLHLHPFRLPNQLGCFLQAGYKTKGYLMGEPLDKGILCRFGLSFVP